MMISYPVVRSLQEYKFTQNAFLPHIVTVPLCQDDYSSSCKSLVISGDEVLEGQVIAKTNGIKNTESYIHSPIPGKVLDIVPCISPNGKHEFAIRIQLKGSFSYLGKKIKKSNWNSTLSSSISSKLIERGVVNTFKINEPRNFGVQLKKNRDSKILIVRLFDEDPTCVTDSLISKFYFEQILEGSQIALKAMEGEQIVFAIDKNLKDKKDFLAKEKNFSNISFLEINSKKYPSGTEKDICYAFNKSLRKTKKNSISKNDIFADSSTMYEVYKAISLETPSLSRPIHFSGNCLYVSCLLNVKIGTSLKDVVNQLGGFLKEPALIIINGSLCGTSVSSLDVPITKYVKSVLFLSKKSFADEQIYSCINCGNCRFVCPSKLSPDIIYNKTINFRELSENLKQSSYECIDCGSCNSVCPSRLPLSQTISAIKENSFYKKET